MKSPHFTPQLLTVHNRSTGILWDLGRGVTPPVACELGERGQHACDLNKSIVPTTTACTPRSLPRCLFSSKSEHWATPIALRTALYEEFNLDLDPCPLHSPHDAHAEGSIPRTGRRVFCNPPYTRQISKWLARHTEPALIVYLLPSRTDTAWFHEFVLTRATEIRFLAGRLRFGDAQHNAPFPSILAIYDNTSRRGGR